MHFSVPLMDEKCRYFKLGLALSNNSSLCASCFRPKTAAIFNGGVSVVIFTLLYLCKLSHSVTQCVVCMCLSAWQVALLSQRACAVPFIYQCFSLACVFIPAEF